MCFVLDIFFLIQHLNNMISKSNIKIYLVPLKTAVSAVPSWFWPCFARKTVNSSSLPVIWVVTGLGKSCKKLWVFKQCVKLKAQHWFTCEWTNRRLNLSQIYTWISHLGDGVSELNSLVILFPLQSVMSHGSLICCWVNELLYFEF